MKQLLYAFGWLSCTISIIIFASAWMLHQKDQQSPVIASTPETGLILGTQTATADAPEMSQFVEVGDARPIVVANFLKRHNSPLKPYDEYGVKLVAIADKYELDFRLLPAIAMQESNLCKVIPENSHNCLGFGIHSRGTLRFESYEAAFETAAKTLKTKYVDIGLTTPAEIMTKYTPSSPNGAWAKSVNQWMAEMRYDDRALGKEKRGDDADLFEFVESSTPTE